MADGTAMVNTLLRRTPVPEPIALVLAARPAYASQLAHNPGLSEATKDVLCRQRLTTTEAKALANGPLSASQLDALCSRRLGSSAVRAIVAYHHPSEEQARRVAGDPPPANLLPLLLAEEYTFAVAHVHEAGTRALLRYAAHHEEAASEVLLEACLENHALECSHLFWHRPKLVALASASDPNVVRAAEMAPHLFGQAPQDLLVALIAKSDRSGAGEVGLGLNPQASAATLHALGTLRHGRAEVRAREQLGWPPSIGPLEHVADSELRSSLVSFLTNAPVTSIYGHLWAFVGLDLARNPTLTARERDRLAAFYAEPAGWPEVAGGGLVHHTREAVLALTGERLTSAIPETRAPAFPDPMCPSARTLDDLDTSSIGSCATWLALELGADVARWEVALELLSTYEGPPVELPAAVRALCA